jgi:hypothetical protein
MEALFHWVESAFARSQSMDEWRKVKLPAGSKLFRVHNFTFMAKGNTYVLEVDEFADGSFSGHGEHSTDKSSVVESVSGTSVGDCLDKLIKKIETRN